MSNLSYIHQIQNAWPDAPAYLEYFSLSHQPFGHEENRAEDEAALNPEDVVQQINVGLTAPGITVLTGTDEAVKASVIERSVGELGSGISVARFETAPARPRHLLAGILEEFGFEPFSAVLPQYRNVLGAFLEHKAQSGEVAVVLINQSEQLGDEVLSELQRFFRDGSPAQGVHIVLVGQPGLVEKLETPFSTLSCKYFSLSSSEPVDVADYVFGCLNAAGLQGRTLFTRPALVLLRDVSGGEVGVIDDICHRALLATAAAGLRKVNKRVLEEVLAGRDGSGYGEQKKASSAPASSEFERNKAGYRRLSSLIMTRDGKHISRFELTKPRLIMGRHKSNDIYIPRPGISLFHAVLVMDGKDVFLFDLRSTNGTTVNGQEIARRKLIDGDVIEFGSLSLKFCQGTSGLAELPEHSTLPGFTETVVLEESDKAEPTMYLQGSL